MNVVNKFQIFEIIEKLEKLKTEQERVETLKKYDIMPLLDVLRGTFDDSIQWNLPEGAPPYTPTIPQSVPSSLLKQHLKFKYFVKGFKESEALNSLRRERMFIDILESVHPKDAEILIAMINKKSPSESLTKEIVQEAFPGLIRK